MTGQDRWMHGKVCLVTGATGGLGQAAALGLARMGTQVVIIGRNPGRISDTRQLIFEAAGCEVDAIQADLSSQTQVRRAAAEFLERYASLDVLINNVGGNFLSYQTSADGYEMTWALNHLNHFLITSLLLTPLKQAAELHGEARILGISSNIYKLSHNRFDRLQKPPFFNGVAAYAQSKRAIIMYTIELARRLSGWGITANAMSPGLVATNVATNNGPFWRGLMKNINRFALSLETGVQPILRLVSDPALKGISGQFFNKFERNEPDKQCCDEQAIRRLWQLSEQATGTDIPAFAAA